MSQIHDKPDEIKRKLRELKRFELKMYSASSKQEFDSNFSPVKNNNIDLIWSKYFDLKEENQKHVKYTIQQLMIMNKEDFKAVMNEYICHLYYWYYVKKGFSNSYNMDEEFLAQLGLPVYADPDEIKRKFRELAKLYHPDNGGDSDKFIEIMEKYNNLK